MIARHVGKLTAAPETNRGRDHTVTMAQDTSDSRRSTLNRW